MKKRSKKYLEVAGLIDPEKTYPIEEAIKLVKKTSTTKFDGSVEVHVRLGINPTKGDQQVRSTVVLPHGTGKTKKIVVFTDNEEEGKSCGADMWGGKELITQIKNTGKYDFDIAVSTPEMMRNLGAIAKILGPKGLMPSPKNDTITKDLKKTIEQLKKGKIPFKNDATANVHVMIGKVSFDETKLHENYLAIIDGIRKNKPKKVKGSYIRNISITSSMGPGVKVIIN